MTVRLKLIGDDEPITLPVSDTAPDLEIESSGTIFDFMTGSDEQDSAPGAENVNPVTLIRGDWFYANLDRIDEAEGDPHESGEPRSQLSLDCVKIPWFESNAPSFDDFYPTGVDDDDTPSFARVYSDSTVLKEPEALAAHLMALESYENSDGQKPNEEHRTAVADLHGEPDQFCYIRWTQSETGDNPLEDLDPSVWYAVELRADNSGPGLPVERIDYTEFDSAEPTIRASSLLRVVRLDDATRRRLMRVISLDFVSDAPTYPTGGGFVMAPPTPVPSPSPLDRTDVKRVKIRVPVKATLFGADYKTGPLHVAMYPPSDFSPPPKDDSFGLFDPVEDEPRHPSGGPWNKLVPPVR